MVLYTINGQWVGDFWEHCAVVRELATNPLSPVHPQLPIDSPHVFYTPYALGVAVMSRALGWDPVTTLSVAGIANLVLFLVSLKVFTGALANREGADFYALLFTLLLWGSLAWEYSGFFHLRVLGYVLPYPATFAAALVLAALAMYTVLMGGGSRLWIAPIMAIAVLVLLTHPPAFAMMAVGVVAISVSVRHLRLRDYVLLGCLLGVPLAVAAVWPYFPFFEFVLFESPEYHQANRQMYTQVVRRIFPALLGLPLVALRFRSNWRDPLGWMVAGLALVYAYGAVSGNWGYGRVISYLVLLLHLAIADFAAQIEIKLKGNTLKLAYLGVILIVLITFSFSNSIQPVLRGAMSGQPSSFRRYKFLSDLTGQYEVLLSDMKTSWFVPAFGGKVVAVLHPLAFVPDQGIRRREVRYFFSEGALDEARLEIIERYAVDYLLLNKKQVTRWQPILHSFQALGDVIFSDEEFVLIDLRSWDGKWTPQRLIEYPLKEQLKHPLHVRFADYVEILGYELDTGDAHPGGVVRLVLYWRALAPMETGYTVFVHLLDAEDEMHGQWDGQPLNGVYPTDVWSPSTVVRDEYAVPVEVDALVGEYRVAVGLYEWATMERLPAVNERGVALDDKRLILDSVVVIDERGR